MTKKRTYPKEDNSKEIIRTLKALIRKRDKEIKKLKSEIQTLETAFTKTEGFLKKQMWDFSVEEVIEAVKKQRRIRARKEKDLTYCECGATMEETHVPRVGTVFFCMKCSNRYTVKNGH